MVVADGIGGAQVGDTAANFAVRAVTDHYYADPRAMSLDRLGNGRGDRQHQRLQLRQDQSGLSTGRLHPDRGRDPGSELAAAHVGDSRA